MLRFTTAPVTDMPLDALRIAIFNYLVAKRRGERFVLRFEDDGQMPDREKGERAVLEVMALFGLKQHEIYYQSHNLTLHQHMAVKLLGSRDAFACFCTPKELQAQKEAAMKAGRPYRYSGGCDRLSDAEVIDNEKPFTVRIKKPATPITFDDPVLGRVIVTPEEVDSFVIMEADKRPTHPFATAVDDMLQDITFVVRSEEELTDTPREIHVRNRLGYDKKVTYAHLPPVRFKERRPLGVRELIEEGFLPEAIANYLVALGNETPERVFTLDEAAEWFDVASLSDTPPIFDLEELRALNREHMRRHDARELSRAFGFADPAIGEAAKCFLEEGGTIREIKPKIDAIFAPKPFGHAHGETMRRLQTLVAESPYFEDFDAFESHLCRETGLTREALALPLRLLLTGAETGPELRDLYPHIKTYLQEIVQ
ncbi:glutamate--tRNA ligase family protein [Hydrogenimonas sp. SS33]|uniref:glutamate--tRNA ligase n=1 Tax=Hydrogenimonas leucolamina TaxID=2954236 RepID=UPI00336BEBD7